jgi:predicted small secreted protein
MSRLKIISSVLCSMTLAACVQNESTPSGSDVIATGSVIDAENNDSVDARVSIGGIDVEQNAQGEFNVVALNKGEQCHTLTAVAAGYDSLVT